MHEIQLRELDLNLLRVFDVIYEERSIAQAAARLYLSPSAVSHALGRLRALLHDDLFVRSSAGMLPTSYAQDIGPRLRESLLQLERSLRPARFNPATSDRRFTISASPYICTALLPRLMDRFHREAPDCEIAISRRTTTLVSDLDLGEIDLAIGRFGRLPKRIAISKLFTDRWVWVVNRDRPGPREDDVSGHPKVMLMPRDQMASDAAIDDRGEFGIEPSPKITLSVEDAMSAIAVAASSGLAAMVPGRLAEAMSGLYPLRIHEIAGRPPIRFDIAWHRMHGQEPSLKWLREMFRWVVT